MPYVVGRRHDIGHITLVLTITLKSWKLKKFVNPDTSYSCQKFKVTCEEIKFSMDSKSTIGVQCYLRWVKEVRGL